MWSRKELDFLYLKNIRNLIIKRIDRTDNIEIHFTQKLNDSDLNNLIEKKKKILTIMWDKRLLLIFLQLHHLQRKNRT